MSYRLKKPTEKAQEYYMATQEKAGEAKGLTFSRKGAGGDLVRALFKRDDLGITASTTLTDLCSQSDEDIVVKLKEFNQNSLRTYFNELRSAKLSSREAVEETSKSLLSFVFFAYCIMQRL